MLTIGEPDSVAEATGMFGQPAPLCLQPLQPPYTWAAAAHYDTPTKSRTRRAVLLLVDSLPFVSHDVLAFQNCKLQSPLSARTTAAAFSSPACRDADASGVGPKIS